MSFLILPSRLREPGQSKGPNLEVFVPLSAVFPGRTSNDEDLVEVLRTMKRDDVLFMCADANTLVSGFGVSDADVRQAAAIARLCAPEQIQRIRDFSRDSNRRTPAVFFRGQLLELMRWAARFCDPAPGDVHAFDDPEARSHFLAAALIASDVWGRRVFADRLALNQGLTEARRRALGPFRKAIEEANVPPHLGISIGRSRSLFAEHMPAVLSDFDDLFRKRTGLSFGDYAIAASALSTYTIAGQDQGPFFNPRTVAAQTQFQNQIGAFLELESQTADELDRSFAATFETGGYRAIRERPILVRPDGRAVVLDPTMFYEKIAVGPLFYAVHRADSLKRGGGNRIFGAFGDAFEAYAAGALRRMHPAGHGMVERVVFSAKGKDGNGDEFEVDAFMVEPVDGVIAAVVFEMKAVFLREEEILNDVTERFIAELRRRYGRDPKGEGRDKGVAQLAPVVGAIVRGDWAGEKDEIAGASVVLPVLLVHDTQLDSPGTCAILNDDFMDLLGLVPANRRVAPLILLTVEDLENLESSVGRFSLAELLWEYHRECPDRMLSLRHFLVGSKYRDLIRPSDHLISQSDEQMKAMKGALFPGSAKDAVVS